MSLKIGDKVRFLNAVGGGIVKRFIDKNIVSVEEEDGFETPVLIKECVIIESGENKTKAVQVVNQTSAGKPSFSKDTTPPAVEKKIQVIETPEGEKLNVVLAFLPNQPKSMLNTSFDCYLVNDSNYFLSVNYMNKSGQKWMGRFTGLIEPNVKTFLEEIEQMDLNELERICIQFIAYKQDKLFDLKNPASVEMRIDATKFYKLHSFRENDYFDEDALTFSIVKNDVSEKPFYVDAKAIERAMQEKEAPVQSKQTSAKKQQLPIIEVDLHANELLETTAGMNNTDILNYQLGKFNETLQQYAGKKGQKIVFIHGKGDGVLRKAILDELKKKYKNYYYQDASFREYGYGATQIQIR